VKTNQQLLVWSLFCLIRLEKTKSEMKGTNALIIITCLTKSGGKNSLSFLIWEEKFWCPSITVARWPHITVIAKLFTNTNTGFRYWLEVNGFQTYSMCILWLIIKLSKNEHDQDTLQITDSPFRTLHQFVTSIFEKHKIRACSEWNDQNHSLQTSDASIPATTKFHG
jgi:hypothetical protein